MTKPAFSFAINGVALHVPQRHLMSLSVQDATGVQSDNISIQIANHDQQIALPQLGFQVRCSLGYENALVDKGSFILDEISQSGPPDVIKLRGRAVDFTKSIKQRRERSWDRISLQDLVKTIAAEHNLVAHVSDQLQDKLVEHEDQTSESDLHFLTRIAKKFDAFFSVKDGRLLFIISGVSKTAYSVGLPLATIHIEEISTYQYTATERDQHYKSVRAAYYDLDGANKKYISAGEEAGPYFIIPETLANEAEARQVAAAKYAEIKKGQGKLSIKLASGRPELIAESPVRLIGFDPSITQTEWVVKDVIHQLDTAGLTSKVNLSVQFK